MDAAALAGRLLGPIPAHVAVDLQVVRAVDGTGEVAIGRTLGLTNVTGALHSSGLITLIDAAGLVAIISVARTEDELAGVGALGAAASLDFRRPAHGPLVATGRLDDEGRRTMRSLLEQRTDKATVHTSATVADVNGVVVSEGRFRWSVRRGST